MTSGSMLGLAFVALTVGGCEQVEQKDPQVAPQPTAAQAAVVPPEDDEGAVAPGSAVVPDSSYEARHAGLVSATTPAAPLDPPWFRADIWPGAKVEGESAGASDGAEEAPKQLLLSLPEGTLIDDCAERLAAQVRPYVPDIHQEPVARGEGNRLTLRGEGDGYQVTIVCGLEQKQVKAYLGYQWTKPPSAEAGGIAGPD